MWWLSFNDGSVVLIAASSLAHARLLAAAQGLGRVSRFVDGSPIDTKHLPPIPDEFIGKVLTPVQARKLVAALKSPGNNNRRRSRRS